MTALFADTSSMPHHNGVEQKPTWKKIMKRNTKIIFAAIAAFTIGTATVAVAGGGHGHMGERIVNKITKKLDLNEQQVASLESLKLEISETRELMHGDTNKQMLKDLIGADTFDQGAAMEMITKRTTAMQTQGPELVAATAQFLDGLNAEQKQEVRDLMDRWGSRKGHRHGNGE